MKTFKEYVNEEWQKAIMRKHGSVVAGKRTVSESTEELKDGKWTLKHFGTIDGKPYGLGGPVHVYTGHSDDYTGTTPRYYLRSERTGNIRLVSREHPIVRKCKSVMANK